MQRVTTTASISTLEIPLGKMTVLLHEVAVFFYVDTIHGQSATLDAVYRQFGRDAVKIQAAAIFGCNKRAPILDTSRTDAVPCPVQSAQWVASL